MDEPPSFEMKSQIPSPKTPNQTNSIKVETKIIFNLGYKI